MMLLADVVEVIRRPDHLDALLRTHGPDAVVDAVRREGAVEAGRIDVMRARERRGKYAARYGKALTPADPADTQSFKVRRGVVGGYRASLSPADIALCEATLERIDYWARLDGAMQLVGIRPAA